MHINLRRARAAAVVLAVAASAAPFIGAPPASAAGTLAGAASVRTAGGGAALASGNSGTTFTLRLPSGAACPGDSANDGYRWQTYMVPASVDPGTLQFDSNGPIPQATGASFRQPLYDTAFSPITDKQTANAATAGGPGPIINIPDMTFSLYAPGDIPAGEYNIGIACTLGPASATQMKDYWNAGLTFTANPSGGPAQVDWAVGTKPAAPVLTSLTPDDGSLTAAFSHTPSDPATTLYTATATPTGGGTAVTATGTVSPIAISGLTNGTSYDVTVRATNTVGDSPESNVLTATPNPGARPAVQNLTATPGTGKVDLSWTAPTGEPPTGYQVDVSPAEGTVTQSGTTAAVTGLTAGTTYTFTVTPLHPAPYVGTPASVQATPFADSVLVQEVTVVRPVGALVLTQICGMKGALAEEPAEPGFPDGFSQAAAVTGGTAPTLEDDSADPKFPEYPYPENADGTPAPNYPTFCGVDLGNAKLVKSGSGAGQFFATHGRLDQVTIVDTRNLDEGWTVNGTMGSFASGADSFSGSQLGWTPVATDDSDAFTDSDGNTYDQVAVAGDPVAPNSPNASGLSAGQVLGSAGADEGLGIAVFDARLKLLIPITADSGTYVGTLTLSAI